MGVRVKGGDGEKVRRRRRRVKRWKEGKKEGTKRR